MSEQISMFSDEVTLSPDMRDFVEENIELFKLDIVQGMAYEQAPEVFKSRGVLENPSMLGEDIAKRLRKLPEDNKRGRLDYKKRLPLGQLYTPQIRSLARRHNIEMMGKNAVLEQVGVEKFTSVVKEAFDSEKIERLHSNLFTVHTEDQGMSSLSTESFLAMNPVLKNLDPAILRMIKDHSISNLPGRSSAPPVILNRGLKFRVNSVKCIDETNPEWAGSDEIAMGATAISDNGKTDKIKEFKVRGGFDDGESKKYFPPRVLHSFPLDNIDYPGDFSVIVALAEKDNGGLSKFIDELWKKIKGKVEEIIKAAGVALGAKIGGTLGTAIGGPLGTIIGAVAGAILGGLIAWLIKSLSDDIFQPKIAAIRLPKPNSLFENGSKVSPTMSLNFRDHGGHYRVYYSWEIVR